MLASADKEPQRYTHLRDHNILALPYLETLNRYMKVIKGTYGFDKNVFKVLEKKTASMSPSDVRGKLHSSNIIYKSQ